MKEEKTKAEIALRKRIDAVRSFLEKEKILKQKKKMKRSDLCRKYNIDPSLYCTAVSLKRIPHWRTINKINAAYAAEGID